MNRGRGNNHLGPPGASPHLGGVTPGKLQLCFEGFLSWKRAFISLLFGCYGPVSFRVQV
jgi:hypothetical protein